MAAIYTLRCNDKLHSFFYIEMVDLHGYLDLVNLRTWGRCTHIFCEW